MCEPSTSASVSDDDAVVAQFIRIVLIATDTASQRGDQRRHFLGREHFIEAGFLNVKDFTLQRQDRLVLAVTTLFSRAARGVPFHQVQFGQRRVALPAIPPVCPAGLPDPARLYDESSHERDVRLPRARRRYILPTTIFASDGFSSRYSLSSSFICCSTADFTSEETSLSLVCEENFGSGTFTDTTAIRPSRASSPVALTFAFAVALFVHIGVRGTGHRRAEAGEVSTAVTLRNIVGKAVDVFPGSRRSTAGPLPRRYRLFRWRNRKYSGGSAFCSC